MLDPDVVLRADSAVVNAGADPARLGQLDLEILERVTSAAPFLSGP